MTQLCLTSDDAEICSKYFEAKNLLETILNCSLSEELSSRPIPLIFPPELLNDLSQYGYIGSPSPPLCLRASFLQDGSKVLITWRQHHDLVEGDRVSSMKSIQRREDIVKFVIQRGVTDLSPLPTQPSHANVTLSTASVPASVSVDRSDVLEDIDLVDENPQGFIHFESIGEVYFDPTTSLSDHTLLTYSKPFENTSTFQRSDTESPHNSGGTTLGIPPLAGSDTNEAVESFEETKSPQPVSRKEGSRNHTQHSFEFDTFDYPLKLLHFRVKSINRDGKIPFSPDPTTISPLVDLPQACRVTGHPPPAL